MQALIVDDEGKAREILQLLVQHHIPEITKTYLAGSGSQATIMLETYQPDLVFLDIKMPGVNGFEWLQSLDQRNFGVIFTTAYDQYAIQAIRFSAFDYLLKPIDLEDLIKSVHRFMQSSRSDLPSEFNNLLHNFRQNNVESYLLTIATTEGKHFIRYKDIVRCEADGNYTYFYLDDLQKIVASKPLGYFSNILEEVYFVRTHKSHLVNMQYVQKIQDGYLITHDGTQVEISRRRRKAVNERLEQFTNKQFLK